MYLTILIWLLQLAAWQLLEKELLGPKVSGSHPFEFAFEVRGQMSSININIIESKISQANSDSNGSVGESGF